MSPRSLQKAFTLTEVLMAAGILAIGFMLIATIFPVGLKLTTMATERTVAGVVLDEAFAKIRIFGIDPNMLPDEGMVYFNHDTSDGYNRLYTKFADLGFTGSEIEAEVVDFVHLYPSTDINTDNKKYSWSALLRWIDSRNAQAIIFVSRKTSTAAQYPEPERVLSNINYGRATSNYIDWPMPVRVEVTNPAGSGPDILQIVNSTPTEVSFFNKGSIILDDENGKVYTVLERRGAGNDEIELDRDWFDEGDDDATSMWVVPPAAGAAGSSCITIFRTTITF